MISRCMQSRIRIRRSLLPLVLPTLINLICLLACQAKIVEQVFIQFGEIAVALSITPLVQCQRERRAKSFDETNSHGSTVQIAAKT